MKTQLLIFSLLLSFFLPGVNGSWLTRGSTPTQESPSAAQPSAAPLQESPAQLSEAQAPEFQEFQVYTEDPRPAGANANGSQSPSYRLILRDSIQMTVYGQNDLTIAQRIDGEGKVRIPLLGNVVVVGKTVRELEDYLERAFIEGEFLRSPMVTVRVTDYAAREITVFGAVNGPGTINLPLEVNSMDIVDVISRVGGFTNVARSNQVRVTRNRGQSNETVEIVNVDAMITGGRNRQEQVLIYPGDLIYVNQTLF